MKYIKLFEEFSLDEKESVLNEGLASWFEKKWLELDDYFNTKDKLKEALNTTKKKIEGMSEEERNQLVNTIKKNIVRGRSIDYIIETIYAICGIKWIGAVGITVPVLGYAMLVAAILHFLASLMIRIKNYKKAEEIKKMIEEIENKK